MVGRAVVTTHYANCTQCATGKYQDMDSEQMSTCAPCPNGKYAAGAHAPLICMFFVGVTNRIDSCGRWPVVDLNSVANYTYCKHAVMAMLWQGPATLSALIVVLGCLLIHLACPSASRVALVAMRGKLGGATVILVQSGKCLNELP